MEMRKRSLAFLVGCAAVAAVLAASMSSGADSAREIVLEARGMAFRMDGADAANPVIRARPGELLRVTVHNRDAGFVHDFAIASLGVLLQPIGTGASASIVFRAPPTDGAWDYACRPHAQMMRGRLEVSSR
jgi:plastocyanin